MMKNNVLTQAKKWLDNADAVLITASNGLSITEGLNLFSSEKLAEVLGKYQEKYHFTNLLEALNYPYQDQVDKWAVSSRVVEYYSNNYKPGKVMSDLKKLIGDKDYFAWTSNVDHQLALAGFKNIIEVEGNWQQASYQEDGERKIIEFGPIAHEIVTKDLAGKLSQADIDELFDQYPGLEIDTVGENFELDPAQISGFEKFIDNYRNKKLVILELGIGPNNQLIKQPSMQLIAGNEKMRYITINKGEISIPDLIRPQSIGISGTIDAALSALNGEKASGLEFVESVSAEKLEKQKGQEAKILQKFYPNYIAQPSHYPGQMSMYLTLDKDTPSYFHLVEEGQSWMYSMGDSVMAYCFTAAGKFYTVRLGLDKTKDEVHGFYVNAGTFVAFESLENIGAGFAQLDGNLPMKNGVSILTPNPTKLSEAFPKQKELIERLSVKNNEIK